MTSHIWNADNGDNTYTNPVLYADYSDPDAIRVGDDYYLVASSFCNAPGLPLLHSKDLVNWELINYVIDRVPGERYEKPVHGCGVWAPSIRYHDGLFYVCFPMPDEGIFMCTAADPYGKWSEPVNIRPGAGWIDPCPFWDEDGKAYLVAGVAKSRIGYKSVLHMVEMDPNGLELIGEEIRIFDGNENDQVTIEGPKLYKRNGWYYIFAPAGGVKTGWQTVLRSKNIYGPYEYRVVMDQGSTEVNGPHQGAWVDTVTGEDWFLHFQDVYAAGRITHLQPMAWGEDDWPVIGVTDCEEDKSGGSEIDGEDHRGHCGHPVMTWRKPRVSGSDISGADKAGADASDQGMLTGKIMTEPVTSQNFKEEPHKLGLQWQWNANYHSGWYSISSDRLRLNAVSKTSEYGDVPNLLLQKWPAPEFVCEYRMDLSGLTPGDEAGVISMGMKYGLLYFRREQNQEITVGSVLGTQVYGRILVDHTDEMDTPARTLPADTSRVTVRYEVTRTGTRDLSETEKGFPLETVRISFAVDGKQNGSDEQDSYELVMEMSSEHGRWVGT